MTDSTRSLKDRPLKTTEELRTLIETLLDRASGRRLWLLFIDDRGCLGDPLIPMDDYPPDPTERTRTDDLGEIDHGSLLMHRIGMLREVTGNEAVVLVWERLGSSAVGADDRLWARAMLDAATELDVPLRAQFVLHGTGVRELQLSDIA
ncbi:hypothetical protein ACI3KS_18100 [Microbacterium sp. ZW T5_45]|uniref:hypothetical protein n=1 Tax=Microbacterium sp. ZW T5_45 TaxID=3378080 RepID=UPI003851DF8B